VVVVQTTVSKTRVGEQRRAGSASNVCQASTVTKKGPQTRALTVLRASILIAQASKVQPSALSFLLDGMASCKEQLPCSKLLHVLPANTQTLKERLVTTHVKTAFQVNIRWPMQQVALCVLPAHTRHKKRPLSALCAHTFIFHCQAQPLAKLVPLVRE